MSIETTLSDDGSFIKFHLKGVFDINRSLQLQDMVDSLPDSVELILIDLENVTRIDTSIFSTLLLLYYRKENHSRIEVLNCDKALAHRLSLAGLDRLITIRLGSSKVNYPLADSEDKQSKDRQ
jgi:anti-anti-sigma factor